MGPAIPSWSRLFVSVAELTASLARLPMTSQPAPLSLDRAIALQDLYRPANGQRFEAAAEVAGHGNGLKQGVVHRFFDGLDRREKQGRPRVVAQQFELPAGRAVPASGGVSGAGRGRPPASGRPLSNLVYQKNTA